MLFLFIRHSLFVRHLLVRLSFVHCLFICPSFVVHSSFLRSFIVHRSSFVVHGSSLIVLLLIVHRSLVCCCSFVVLCLFVCRLSQLCRMSPCRFLFPNGDTACRVGDILRHVRGHVGDFAKCRVGQGAQNDTTCRLLPTFADISAVK